MQHSEKLAIREDGSQYKNYHRPTSFVEEIQMFLEVAWVFILELRELFRGRWYWVIIGVPVATIIAWAIAVLWLL